jgi:peptidoglycan/LPS O-acetylase OafA/YrhL
MTSCCVLFAATVALCEIVPPPYDTAVIILILAFSLPLLFAATKTSALDRRIGELSYPIYLLHIPVGWLVIGLLKRTNWSQMSGPFLTGAITILASVALTRLVLMPLEKFRLRLKH